MQSSKREKNFNYWSAVFLSGWLVILLIVSFQFIQIKQLKDELSCYVGNSKDNNKSFEGSASAKIDLCSLNSSSDSNSGSMYGTIYENASKSICLIQGEYRFVDLNGNFVSWRKFNNSIAASNIVEKDLNLSGNTIEIHYTGSGFVAKDGYIVTNKHVAVPWSETKRDRNIMSAGFRPKMIMFRAFFPGIDNPVQLEYVAGSEDYDIAILKFDNSKYHIPALECDYYSDVNVGMPLTIVGYPTGFDLLTARINESESSFLYTDFNDLGVELARSNAIKPMVTGGICGQVTPAKIAYDAATAIGASGAPVLNSSGKVIAVNTALLKGFTGTNFGIHVSKIQDLLNYQHIE